MYLLLQHAHPISQNRRINDMAQCSNLSVSSSSSTSVASGSMSSCSASDRNISSRDFRSIATSTSSPVASPETALEFTAIAKHPTCRKISRFLFCKTTFQIGERVTFGRIVVIEKRYFKNRYDNIIVTLILKVYNSENL